MEKVDIEKLLQILETNSESRDLESHNYLTTFLREKFKFD